MWLILIEIRIPFQLKGSWASLCLNVTTGGVKLKTIILSLFSQPSVSVSSVLEYQSSNSESALALVVCHSSGDKLLKQIDKTRLHYSFSNFSHHSNGITIPNDCLHFGWTVLSIKYLFTTGTCWAVSLIQCVCITMRTGLFAYCSWSENEMTRSWYRNKMRIKSHQFDFVVKFCFWIFWSD